MDCEHWTSGACHSCTAIDLPYPEQLAAKQARIEAELAAVPGADAIEWLPACPSSISGFRTNAKLVVGGTRRRPTLGILGPDRRGVDLPGCPIQHPAINAAAIGLKRLIRALDLEPYDVPTKHGELKNILITVGADDRLMIRFVLRSRDRVADLRRALPRLRELVPTADVVTANIHPTHEAIVEGPDEIILSKAKTLPLALNDAGMRVGPRSFVQTNTAVASQLYRQAAEWAILPFASGGASGDGSSDEAGAPSSLWDLYCGVGGFALHAAAAGIPHVTGVEVSDGAISSAIATARRKGLEREAARFIVADATQWAREQPSVGLPDVVVVNPPRRGIGSELSEWVEGSAVRRVIYSSCNPRTLARDLAEMPSLCPVRARLFDMFPHTDHAEVAVLLERARDREHPLN